MLVSNCGCVTTDNFGRELISHGEIQFPIAIYNDRLDRQYVDWHWHEELELIYQMRGRGLYIMNDKKLVLNEGEGLFINSEVLHGCWDNQSQISEICSLVFHPGLIGGSVESIFWQKYLEPLMNNKGFNYYHFQTNETDMTEDIKLIWQMCYEGKLGYELKVRNSLSDIIFRLYEKQTEKSKALSKKSVRNNERIKLMLNFIQNNYMDAIKISDIARSAMLSDSECLRCFRDTIKTSPGQYLKNFRLSRASELLKNTSYAIHQISDLCGFSDVSYFVNTFRKSKGMTPGEYREMNRYIKMI